MVAVIERGSHAPLDTFAMVAAGAAVLGRCGDGLGDPRGPVIVISGGRHWTDKEFVWRHMDLQRKRLGFRTVIHGDCPTGVDRFVRLWCRARHVMQRPYPADWDNLGDAAGTLRNQQMIDEEPEIEHALIFPGGSGTMDMARRCRKAGIERTFINAEEDPLKELARWG